MREIENKIEIAKWIVLLAVQVILTEVVLPEGELTTIRVFFLGLCGAVTIIFLNGVAGRLLWLVRDFGRSEFERGKNRRENWSELTKS